ncbi:MAG TPA: hypothetical protein VIT65_14020 [Microlunatus sp.]
MDRDLRIELLLSLQRAMWECVTPDLRGVAVALTSSELRSHFSVRFLYAGDVGEFQTELVSLTEAYLISDFNQIPSELTVSFEAVPQSPRELSDGEEWFYLRWEPLPDE